MVVEYLDQLGWSQSDLARRSGLTPKTISEICNGKAPITPTTALAFEKVFMRAAHFWLNLQRQYDEAVVRSRQAQLFSGWATWADAFPIKEMKKRQWIPRSDSREADVQSLLEFFGVASPSNWQSVNLASSVAFRPTRKFKTSREAVWVWLRASELAVSELSVTVQPFEESRLRESIDELRRLTTKGVDRIVEPVQEICAAAGVAVVCVPEIPHTGISGSARWLSDRKALIALTLRYKTDDQLWFTFFHELGHILLHRRRLPYVVDNADTELTDGIVDPQMQRYEEEAYRFAADTLIPPDELASFISKGVFDNDSITTFANRLRIGPGILVGRLQHERILAPHQGNAFKQRIHLRSEQEEP